jgi:hypothetical protein
MRLHLFLASLCLAVLYNTGMAIQTLPLTRAPMIRSEMGQDEKKILKDEHWLLQGIFLTCSLNEEQQKRLQFELRKLDSKTITSEISEREVVVANECNP